MSGGAVLFFRSGAVFQKERCRSEAAVIDAVMIN
jgi:hypothetical protein